MSGYECVIKKAFKYLVNLTSFEIIYCAFNLLDNADSIKTKITSLKITACALSARFMEYILDCTPNLEVIFCDNSHTDELDHHPLIHYLNRNSGKIKCLSYTAQSMDAVKDLLKIPLNLQYFHLAVLKECYYEYDQPIIMELQRFCLAQNKRRIYLNVDYNTQSIPVNLLELENVTLLHAFDEQCRLTSPDRFKCFWTVRHCFLQYSTGF